MGGHARLRLLGQVMTTDNDIFSAAGQGDEELTPFDVRDSASRSGIIKLALGFGFLLALALIILKVYQPGTRDRDAPPKIVADNTPFKVPPKDAGGMQTPNQDKVVFDVMDGQSPNTTTQPAPLPENPVTIDTPVITAPAPVVRKPIAVQPPVAAPKPIANPIPRPVQTPTVSLGGSDFVVQVASLRSQSEAEASWDAVMRKFPTLLAGTSSDIKRVDLAEKGIYYRTRVSGLSDRDSANELCNALKAAGQSCFVTRR